jgi:hypothetical protein
MPQQLCLWLLLQKTCDVKPAVVSQFRSGLRAEAEVRAKPARNADSREQPSNHVSEPSFLYLGGSGVKPLIVTTTAVLIKCFLFLLLLFSLFFIKNKENEGSTNIGLLAKKCR